MEELMTSEVDNLAQRVAKLERHNRQLKMVVLGVALCMATFFLVGAAKPPRTLEAEKLVILDRHGRARITIGTPAISGATVDVNPDDPVIWLRDDKGTDRAMLATDGLFFANSKARPTVRLDSDTNGLSGLKFYGTDGKVSWSAP
jgi:hypothetical protein